MPQCSGCTKHMMRTHRSAMERFIYADVFRCTRCERQFKRMHPVLRATIIFVRGPHSHCIKCGTPDVDRLKKRDRIDSVSRHPASILLALTRAPFNRCSTCRLQYHDWRRPARTAHSS